MKCLIIEDEYRALKHLESQLIGSGEPVQIINRIDSVEESVLWLKQNEVDLIFMDIELGDGLCFEIFNQIEIRTPVIFTTSYNDYIAKAFEVNSIAYLLKPIQTDELKKALSKYQMLFSADFQQKVQNIQNDYQKRFLIHSGNILQLVNINEISFMRVESKRFVIATTFANQQHLIDGTLEDIERRIDPASFFRINRQLIVNIKSIAKMQKLDKGRVKLDLLPQYKEEAVVSVDRAPAFKKWLEQ